MCTIVLLRRSLLSLVFIGTILAATLLAETAGYHFKPVAMDVELMRGGQLIGQVLDQQGSPQAKQVVEIRHNSNESPAAHTVTDPHGRFAFRGLRGGSYELKTIHGSQQVRLWREDTAPFAAHAAVLLLDNAIVRGQNEEALWNLPGPQESTLNGTFTPNRPTKDISRPVRSVITGSLPSDEPDVQNGAHSYVQQEPYPEYRPYRPYHPTPGSAQQPVRILGLRPWVWGVGIATAIAVPLAVDDDDDAS